MTWINAKGERIERIEAQERMADLALAQRGVMVAECPHCRAIMQIPTDGTPVRCTGTDDPYWGEAGCGRMITIGDMRSP